MCICIFFFLIGILVYNYSFKEGFLNENAVTAYSDINYTGRSQTFASPGSYRDVKFKSIRIPAGITVAGYDGYFGYNPGNNTIRLTTDNPDTTNILPGFFDSLIHSMDVSGSTAANQAAADAAAAATAAAVQAAAARAAAAVQAAAAAAASLPAASQNAGDRTIKIQEVWFGDSYTNETSIGFAAVSQLAAAANSATVARQVNKSNSVKPYTIYYMVGTNANGDGYTRQTDPTLLMKQFASVKWTCGNNPTLKNTTGNYLTQICLLYTSPSPRDRQKSRMPSSA